MQYWMMKISEESISDKKESIYLVGFGSPIVTFNKSFYMKFQETYSLFLINMLEYLIYKNPNERNDYYG